MSTTFINVFLDKRGKPFAGGDVFTKREEAIEDAENAVCMYSHTLTETGKIDLTDEFSEAFHEQRDFDAAVDRRIDEMKEERFEREGA